MWGDGEDERGTLVHTMTMPKRQELVDARMLPELVELYFQAKRTDVSAQTERNYREQLAPFLTWFRTYCTDGTLSRERLVDFANWMRDGYVTRYGRKASQNTAAHCVGRFKGFANWAFTNGCTGTVNLADWTPIMRKQGSRLYFPTVEEMAKLFEAPHGVERLSDLALFSVILSTGMRLMEAAYAVVDAVTWTTPPSDLTLGHDHSGTIHLRRVKFDAQGEGVGRIVVFCSTTGLLLKVWIRSGARSGQDTLFDLSDSGISQVVKRRAREAGLPELSPHAFRRAFADYWHDKHGMEGHAVLKRQLGHSLKGDVTFDHYIDPRNQRRVAEEIRRWHTSPVERIVIDWAHLPVHIV